MGIPIVSKCVCCDIRIDENINHLFLTSPVAQKLWGKFVTCAGFAMEGSLILTLNKRWRHEARLRAKSAMNVIPAIIVWEF